MPKLTYYVQGSWNVTCDECGRGFKSGQLRKRWDNALVCSECWEPRQPQDFVRGVKDDQSVPFARPRLNLPTGAQWSFDSNGIASWSNTTGFLVFWA